MTASSSKQQATTNESHVTKPININTHFSLKGNPKPDVMDHENKLPATVGDMPLKNNIKKRWSLKWTSVKQQSRAKDLVILKKRLVLWSKLHEMRQRSS